MGYEQSSIHREWLAFKSGVALGISFERNAGKSE
jgi:hypothetical protein